MPGAVFRGIGAAQYNPKRCRGRIEASMDGRPITRRQLLKAGAVASAGLAAMSLPACMRPQPTWTYRKLSPNQKLDIGIVGCGNRSIGNIGPMLGENIVAICDVDERYLGALGERWPQTKDATGYRDFRRMLEREKLDAVVISTADHTHALPAVMAMTLGMHVYCEKPLTRTVHEARVVAETAKRYRRVTQMGTQIHAGTNFRRVVELVQADTIGAIKEVHVWCNRQWAHVDLPAPSAAPADLDWDLWLGPSPNQPYRKGLHPVHWRRYWDFGNGALGDMGCHYLDLPYWALKLRHPRTIEAIGPEPHPIGAPADLIVNYEYPARGDLPALKLTWYDGSKCPATLADHDLAGWPNGVLFVGGKGLLLADYTRHTLLPESQFADFEPPEPSIPDSIGHHAEWLEACKTGGTPTCHFDYAGPLTEAALLGNVAFRAREKLYWNAQRMIARHTATAQQFIRTTPRKGWEM